MDVIVLTIISGTKSRGDLSFTETSFKAIETRPATHVWYIESRYSAIRQGKLQRTETRLRQVTIGIIEDQPAVLAGLTHVFHSAASFRVVTTAATVDDFMRSHTSCDFVVLGLSLSDKSCPSTNTSRLCNAGLLVIGYAPPNRPDLIALSRSGGAYGVVCKTSALSVLLAAIIGAKHAVERGTRPLTVEVSTASSRAKPGRPETPQLTDREKQVLKLYAAGDTAKRVASNLNISVDTVNDHIKRVRSKYLATGRPTSTKVELFMRAREDGHL